MRCPYKGFEECIVEKCPSCNYQEIKREVVDGRYPNYMSIQEAVDRGLAWESTRITYKFVSCKLIENGAQPIPPKKETINNTTRTNVVIRKSVF